MNKVIFQPLINLAQMRKVTESRGGSHPDRSELWIAGRLDCLWDKQLWSNIVNGLGKKFIQWSADRTMGTM